MTRTRIKADVLIYEEGNSARQDLHLHHPLALPLKQGDLFAVVAEMEGPAYLYILWIDPDGEVHPAYPWEPGHWDQRPDQEKPVSHVRRPNALDKYSRLPMGTPGMHTLVLLARLTPLPSSVDLRAELGQLPKQVAQGARAAVWFENGRVVADRPGRARMFDVVRVNDPVKVTQERIREKLMPHFVYTRAVSFAAVPAKP